MEIEDPIIDKATLEKITTAALLQISIEKKIEDLEEQTSQAQKELTQVAGGFGVDGQIPSLMAEAGVLEIVLAGGMRVKVDKELKAPSMAQDSEKREVVLAWADRSGNTGVIKDLISIFFDKDSKKVQALMVYLKENAVEYERYRSIHPATLKKLFNEILEHPKEGETLPMEELGIQQFQRSAIIPPKPPKVKKG